MKANPCQKKSSQTGFETGRISENYLPDNLARPISEPDDHIDLG